MPFKKKYRDTLIEIIRMERYEEVQSNWEFNPKLKTMNRVPVARRFDGDDDDNAKY